MNTKQKIQLIEKRKLVDYHTKEWTLKSIAKYLEKHSNDVFMASYKEIEYIEGILLDFPLPNVLSSKKNSFTIFLSNQPELMAITRFINNKIKLEHMKYLTEFDEMYFKDLSNKEQTKFLNKTISVRVLEQDYLDFDEITIENIARWWTQY